MADFNIEIHCKNTLYLEMTNMHSVLDTLHLQNLCLQSAGLIRIVHH